MLTGAQNADKLLDMWVRILSQTEHTQRLLFNPEWHGATRDDKLQQEREQELEAERLRAEEREREQRQMREAEERSRREAIEEQRQSKDATLLRRRAGVNKRPGMSGSSGPTTHSSSGGGNSSNNSTAGVRKQPTNSTWKSSTNTSKTNLRSRPSTIPRPVFRRQ